MCCRDSFFVVQKLIKKSFNIIIWCTVLFTTIHMWFLVWHAILSAREFCEVTLFLRKKIISHSNNNKSLQLMPFIMHRKAHTFFVQIVFFFCHYFLSTVMPKKLSSNFYKFVVVYAWDTPKTIIIGLWQIIPKVSSALLPIIRSLWRVTYELPQKQKFTKQELNLFFLCGFISPTSDI